MTILEQLDKIVAEDDISFGLASTLGGIKRAVKQLQEENRKLKANWERQKEKVNQVQGELNSLDKKYNDLLERIERKIKQFSSTTLANANRRELVKELEELKQGE